MTSPYSFLQLMSHIYGIVPYYLEPGEAFPLPTIGLIYPLVPCHFVAGCFAVHPLLYKSPYCIFIQCYTFGRVLLGIVFWMAGEAELSTEISSSVDGLSYSAFALCSFAATYCICVHTTYHV